MLKLLEYLEFRGRMRELLEDLVYDTTLPRSNHEARVGYGRVAIQFIGLWSHCHMCDQVCIVGREANDEAQ